MDRSLLSGALSIFFGKFGSITLSILITPILVRLLESGPYGDYAFVMSSLAIATILINFGITDGIRKFIAEDRSVSRWQDAVFAFYTEVAIGMLLGAIGVILVLDATGLIERAVGADLSNYAIVFCVLLAADQLETIGRNTLMGLGLERVSEPLTIIRRAVFGATAIGFVLLGWGATGALLGQVVGFGFVAVVMLGYIYLELDWKEGFRVARETIPARELLRYNTLTVVLILFATTLYNVDVILLRTIVGDSAAGYYKGALVIAEFLWFIPMMLQTLLVHSTSELWSQGDSEQVSTIASRVIRYTMLLVLLPLIGLAVLADVFVPLYLGDGFTAAVDPLLVLLPGVFGLALTRPLLGIGQGKGQLRVLILATGSSAVVNIMLNIALIPRYGMMGAAIATSIGYGSMALFHSKAAFHLGYNPFREMRVRQIGATAIATGSFLYALSGLIDAPIIRLVLIPPIGFGLYVFFAVATGAIDDEERQTARQTIQNWLNID